MKRLFLTLTVIAFCLAIAQPSSAKSTEKSDEIGTYVVYSIPGLMAIMAANSAFIGSPEIASAVLVAFGAYKTHIGDWGKDGTQAIKNCQGTHVNGNCAHLRLDSLGTGQVSGGFVGHN